ncbi:hypothetical protein KO516_23865 [Citreicella sp. C3M06]|uniref:hypothetical protein n=1 Tax=Citreicella sp. C3M06 TaxID=2841564 RepID=UPI001C0819A5|nr:hypothetical protein [Citreicella sp. C3M06]MBU2963810.1 hypothetical protein [Citreicella sp. C3M06]
MTPRLTSVFALALALLFSMSSVVSSAMMAPDRATLQLEAQAMALGLSDIELCGEMAHAEHHCPLCHGLPEAPRLARADVTTLLRAHDGWRRGDDLWRAAQARNPNHSPRAPPASA